MSPTTQPAAHEKEYIPCQQAEAQRILQVTLQPKNLNAEQQEFYLREKPLPKENELSTYLSPLKSTNGDYSSSNGGFGTHSSIGVQDATANRVRLKVSFSCVGGGAPKNYDVDKTVEIPFGPEQTVVLSDQVKLTARYVAAQR